VCHGSPGESNASARVPGVEDDRPPRNRPVETDSGPIRRGSSVPDVHPDAPIPTRPTPRPARPIRHRVAVAAALTAALGGLAACSDDDEPSAQEQYCDAGESLQSSVNALVDLDVVAEGTNGVEAAVGQVADDVDELRSSASDAAAEEVDALETAVDDLGDSLSDLSGELTQENATAVVDAISAVSNAAGAVYDTLSDC
jgi:hypothetical protein